MLKEIRTKFSELKPKFVKALKPQNIYNNCESYLVETRAKLSDLAKTNLDLAIYHLQMGNVNDAILRFKLVKKYSKETNNSLLFYLGRCYLAKKKNQLAKEFFEEYLATKDKKFIEETKYSLQIIADKTEKIDSLPGYIINLKNNQFFHNYKESYWHKDLELDKKLTDYLEEQHQFFDTHILDIGCYTPQSLHKFTSLHDCKYILGIANKQIINIDRFLDEKKTVYNKFLKKDYVDLTSTNFKLNVKFHIIFALDICKFKPNFEKVLLKLMPNLEDHGVIIISCKTSEDVKDYRLDPVLEEFVYNEKYIGKTLEKNKCKIWHSDQRKKKQSNYSESFIFIRKKLK
jgi:predicted TPR repeat methyltransferase